MTRYFVSDLHFGHRNVINYCDRPYAHVDEMNKEIVRIWNETVKPEDEVYVLGDFSLNPKQAEIWTPALNGIKHLITGNHDACFPFVDRTEIRNHNLKQRYLEMGWASVERIGSLELSNGVSVLMSHFPYRDNLCETYDVRYLEYRPMNLGTILLHGHQHSRYIKHKNMIDVGFDGKLQLYSESDIMELIEDKREYIPSRLTEYYKQREREKNETE